ncbi:hypothetical protein U9M48_009564 [Paspalum notatum var. saurae]|uniref:BTB/POZ and MATH domain-containing protein 2 n=1 Tax=Paspalum notatum var. saurae TaxID=547442 RepID=A0AAQ3SRC8_PASNO
MPALDFASANFARGAETKYLYVDRSSDEMIETPSFNVGDCYWRISCYPNGLSRFVSKLSKNDTDHMSINLTLDGRVAKPIIAQVTFSLLDQHEEPVPGHSICLSEIEYSEVGSSYGCDEFFIHKEFLKESGYLVSADCFTVACHITVYRDSPLSDLQQHLLDTDVVFQVGGKTFRAHRSVLAARSPVLEAELYKGTTTAGASCIQIDDMLPQGPCGQGGPERPLRSTRPRVGTDCLPHMDGVEEPMMAERLLAAADRFNMEELKLICEEKLIRLLNDDTAAKILKLAVRHRSSFLREACIEFLEDAPCLEAAMAMDGDLCEHVAKFCPGQQTCTLGR